MGARMGGASSRASGRGRGARVGFRPPPAATARTRIRSAASPQMRPGAPRCGTGCGARARRGGLTFLAAERRVPGEREEGAQAEEQQRQEGAIAEPHLLGCAAGAGGAEAAWPGRPGPGRGAGWGGDGGPGPGAGRGGARGRAGLASAPPGLWARVAGTGPRSAAGPGRTGLGWAARAAARPGSGAAAESAARGGAGRPGFKGAAAPAVAASTTRRRGGDQLPP